MSDSALAEGTGARLSALLESRTEANRRFLAQNKPPPPVESAPADLGTQARTSVWHQFSTIARRQVRLVVSDRAYFTFLALLPFVLGALSLTVPGNTGFGVAQPTSGTPDGRNSEKK